MSAGEEFRPSGGQKIEDIYNADCNVGPVAPIGNDRIGGVTRMGDSHKKIKFSVGEDEHRTCTDLRCWHPIAASAR